MSEAKPFASLSSGLLARKGAARPAMRPQGFTQQSAALEDLGWNDMGHDPSETTEDGQVVEHPRSHHPTGLSPVTSPVSESTPDGTSTATIGTSARARTSTASATGGRTAS